MHALTPERAEDGTAIDALLDHAFGANRHERTVYQLRLGAPLAALSLVARKRGRLIGSLRFWPVEIDRGADAVLLGPLVVDPAMQGQGIGKALVANGLSAAAKIGSGLLPALRLRPGRPAGPRLAGSCGGRSFPGEGAVARLARARPRQGPAGHGPQRRRGMIDARTAVIDLASALPDDGGAWVSPARAGPDDDRAGGRPPPCSGRGGGPDPGLRRSLAARQAAVTTERMWRTRTAKSTGLAK